VELHHLRYFEAIARHGHVTRAARELHLAQPSLSKQLRLLEAELGVALFDRVGRRLELTEAGRLFLPYARRVLAEVAAAREAMEQYQNAQHGRVAIGAPPTVGTQLLPAALAAFNRRFPGVELEQATGAGLLQLELLHDGSVHLAVVSVPVAGVACAELFTEDLVLAAGVEHRLSTRDMVAARELVDEPFILFPVGYELRERTLQLCRGAGFEPRVVLDGAEMDTVLRCAAAGLGVAIVPRLALAGAEGLAGLRIEEPLTRTLGLVWHPERQLPPAAAALREFLLDRLRPGNMPGDGDNRA
jgi:LysR family transcriptional regulator, transcription activator of glutamate synthase operon